MEDGGKWGKLWEILDARWKNGEFWGLKRSKNMVLIGNKAMGGCIGESSQGKMGENGKIGETKPVHPSPTLFVICLHLPHNTPFPPISSHFPLISPHFLPFPPHFPHCPPFPPISPHFPWYWVHYRYVAGYTTHLVRVFPRPAKYCYDDPKYYCDHTKFCFDEAKYYYDDTKY